MMWLIKFIDSWADEIDIEGFSVMSTGQFTQWARTVEEVAKKIDDGYSFEWYVGANEWIDWKTGKDFKEAFSCDVITDKEAEVLKCFLLEGYGRYGFFPSGQDMNYFLEDKSGNP